MSCEYCECGYPITPLPRKMKEGFFGAKEIPNIEEYTCPKCGRIYKLQGYKGITNILGVVGMKMQPHKDDFLQDIDYVDLRLVTKDEFILHYTTGKWEGNSKEHVLKMFEKASGGHEFVFYTHSKDHTYSVEYIDRLLNS